MSDRPDKNLYQCAHCGKLTESKLLTEIWDGLEMQLSKGEDELDRMRSSKADLHARLAKAIHIVRRQRDSYRDLYWLLTGPSQHDRNEIARDNDREIVTALDGISV